MKKAVYFLLCVLATGCYQISSNDEDLNTTPITNNPQLIPGPAGASPIPSAGQDAMR